MGLGKAVCVCVGGAVKGGCLFVEHESLHACGCACTTRLHNNNNNNTASTCPFPLPLAPQRAAVTLTLAAHHAQRAAEDGARAEPVNVFVRHHHHPRAGPGR